MKTKVKIPKEIHRLYILMRTDLPSMTTGRAMAQASHAANAFIGKFGLRKEAKAWQKETEQSFGTAIVLAATLSQIKEIFLNLSECHNLVVDPEYGVGTTAELVALIDPRKIQADKTIINDDGSAVIFKSEVTCGYVFGTKTNLDPILGYLKLHP